MEIKESPQYKNEADVIRDYLPRIIELNDGKPCEINGIIGQNEHGSKSRAWRIILKSVIEQTDFHTGLIVDWDDTLEPYTERKARLYRSYLSLIPSSGQDTKEKFIKACFAINRASRVLPPTGAHPEKYAPYLELLATTILIKSVNEGELPQLLIDITKSSRVQAEELARTYLQQNVLQALEGVEVKTETGTNGPKDYFIEKKLQSTSISFRQKPPLVDDEVWQLYRTLLTENNIPGDELPHFDLPDNARFFVASFGEADFQLEKILNGLNFLKANGKRIPDEIILFTRGRKNSIVRKVIEDFPQAQFIYVDDSPRQIENLGDIDRLIPIHAQRVGSQRSAERVAGIQEVDMRTTKMSQIIGLVNLP